MHQLDGFCGSRYHAVPMRVLQHIGADTASELQKCHTAGAYLSTTCRRSAGFDTPKAHAHEHHHTECHPGHQLPDIYSGSPSEQEEVLQQSLCLRSTSIRVITFPFRNAPLSKCKGQVLRNLPDNAGACRLVVILDQRVNIYALETLEKLCTLETAPNPKVQHLPAYHLCISADCSCSVQPLASMHAGLCSRVVLCRACVP